LLVSAVLLVSCAETTRVFTQEELQEMFYDSLTPVGAYFWDDFGRYRNLYNLSDEESMILGNWHSYGGGAYHFFPNHLFVFRGFCSFKDDPAKLLEVVMGTWTIRGNAVYIRIYGVDISTGREEYFYDTAATHEYTTVEPYDVKLINIRDIHPNGYITKPFTGIKIPGFLRGKLQTKRPLGTGKIEDDNIPKGLYALRTLYTIHPISDTGKRHAYGFFSLLPLMVKDGVSGLDIVTNPALVDKYFVQSLSRPYETMFGYIYDL
jgi:hypothetical protein